MLALVGMGLDPSSAETILEYVGDDQIALEELVEDMSERAERLRLNDMLNMAIAYRAGSATGKDGVRAYRDWRNQVLDMMKPRPKKTVFDRLSHPGTTKRETVWDRIGAKP